ncbi:hypothetical protein EH221_03560 [bacterium]|nr:MAG: hypothetical protein EH221_03560 [bacterium]
MMRKFVAVFLIGFMLVTLVGCYTNTHVVGKGAQGSDVTTARQWYVLFGLIPINEVDSQQMTGGAKDYTITTQFTFIDIVIGAFTGVVSIQPMTVTVTK